MTDEIHMPPGVAGRRQPAPEPEAQPERVTVLLEGGPAHGQTVSVRADRRRIEVPYAPEAETPEVPADGSRPKVKEITAFTLVYLRAAEDSETAAYHDLEMDA